MATPGKYDTNGVRRAGPKGLATREDQLKELISSHALLSKLSKRGET